MGTKVFDKGMMTYQSSYGEPYTNPIYCWYLEGGDQKIDTGELSQLQPEGIERSIGGKIYKLRKA